MRGGARAASGGDRPSVSPGAGSGRAVNVRALNDLMAGVLCYLVALLAVVVALGSGMSWERLLHWTGSAFLVAGILLAAKGISDVRREWTSRPGVWFMARRRSWLWWNRFAALPAVEALGARQHRFGAVNISMAGGMHLGGEAVVTATWVPPAGASYKERIQWLEERITQASERFSAVEAALRKETKERQAAAEHEQRARASAVADVKKDVVDLAAGGLRLQAWSVAFLVAGTVLTAFF